MATIKSYTDLEQSKKLAEILPLESADMRFCFSHTLGGRITGHYPMIGREPSLGTIPCWSLAALLGVMICPNLEEDIEGVWDLTAFTDNSLKTPIEIQDCKDPIDVCVAMIEKLHKLKIM